MKIDGVKGELYFHILKSSRRLRYGDSRVVVPGKELKAKKTYRYDCATPELCCFGMHASKSLGEASDYMSIYIGNWICIVRVNDHVVYGEDKLAGLRRKVVAMRQVKTANSANYLYRIAHDGQRVYDWVMANPWDGVSE